ncbi:MAG: cytochrome c [Cyclobacteriaceae bacterium]
MKRKNLFYLTIFTYILVMVISVKCAVPKYVTEKSGAQLWGESCVRCHNTASPTTFSDTEWDVAVTHMEIRAQLTEQEANKIYEFMTSAN